jgi:hypothetical protein
MRRVLAGLLAVWLTILQFPVPIPAPAPKGKDRSVPFICMDRACGCQSAEQCWESCCCTTVEERIAFARSLGLPIPAKVCQSRPSKHGPCCAEGSEKGSRPEKKDDPPGSEGVVLAHALRCRGIAMNLLQFAGVVVAAPRMAVGRPVATVGTIVLTDDRETLDESAPPTPPPRGACAV